jgi:anti-sigma factor RsiW
MNDERLPPCADFEHEIVELEEGLLTGDAARRVRAHLDGCPRCRGWLAEWSSMDAALAAALPPAAVSPGFTDALMARIATESRRAPVAVRRGAAEQEYELAQRALQATFRRNAVALLALAAALIAAAVLAGPWLVGHAEVLLDAFGPKQRTLAQLGGVAAVVLATLGWAASRDVLPLPRYLR